MFVFLAFIGGISIGFFIHMVLSGSKIRDLEAENKALCGSLYRATMILRTVRPMEIELPIESSANDAMRWN